MRQMSNAGWYATTVNYIWPCSLGVASFLPIKCLFEGKTIRPLLIGATVPMILVSCNQEQMAAIVFCVYLIMGVYYYHVHKTIPRWYTGLFILIVCSVAFLLLSPGTRARTVFELHWYPAYENFSFLQKLFLGIATASMEIIFNPNGISLMLTLLVLLYSLCRKSVWKGIWGCVPFGMMLLNYVDGTWVTDLSPRIKWWITYGRSFSMKTGIRLVPPETIPFNRRNLAVLAMSLLFVVSLLTTVFMMLHEVRERYLAVLVLLAGFCSRWIIGFSPTVFASNNRTFLFLHMSFAGTILMLYPACERGNVIRRNVTYFILALAALYSAGEVITGSVLV